MSFPYLKTKFTFLSFVKLPEWRGVGKEIEIQSMSFRVNKTKLQLKTKQKSVILPGTAEKHLKAEGETSFSI